MPIIQSTEFPQISQKLLNLKLSLTHKGLQITPLIQE